ncbi:phosphodiester glycosidase family protein [Candidatus Dependentiae bacterium]|nr:phosphodiester glycosidase family protein [Candidatus Dependentiae bacterium]
MNRYKFLFLISILLIIFSGVEAFDYTGENFEYTEFNNYYFNSVGPLEIRVIKLNSSSSLVEVGLAKGVNLKRSSILLKQTKGTACVNANYFDPNSGRILGVYGVRNKIISEPVNGVPARPVLVIYNDGTARIIKIDKNNIKDLTNFKIAIGGGPTILRSGRVFKKFRSEKFINKRNPLTAVGVDIDGNLYFITVDGRQRSTSIGLKYNELAEFLNEQFDIIDAMCFDGGGSTTMVLDDPYTTQYDPEIMNQPSDRKERKVASIIYFKIKKQNLKISFDSESISGIFYQQFKKKYSKVYNKNKIAIGRTTFSSLNYTDKKRVVVLTIPPGDLPKLTSFKHREDLMFLIFIKTERKLEKETYLFNPKTNKYHTVSNCSYNPKINIPGKVLLNWRNVVDQNPSALIKQGNFYIFNGDISRSLNNLEFTFFLINTIINNFKEVA